MGYTCVLLGKRSKFFLLRDLTPIIENGWDARAHHMTVNLGEPKDHHKPHLGKRVRLVVDAVGSVKDRVHAIRVISATTEDGVVIESTNTTAHITTAVNIAVGAKPRESNDIKEWIDFGNPAWVDGIFTFVED